MNTIKFKHIVIGLVIAFILFLFSRIGDQDYSYDHSGTHIQGPIPTQSYYHSLDSKQAYPYSSTWSHNPPSSPRHEILQTTLKGYREETFWGEELNDADVYWGATY